MALFDFKCPEGHVAERFVRGDVREAMCLRCDLTSTRQISAPTVVGPTTNIRGMFRRYQEASADIAHETERYEASTGRTAPPLNAWSQAKSLAAAMTAAGEAPTIKGF